jgi:hypothetical protein
MSERGGGERKSPASNRLFYRELGEVGKQGHTPYPLSATCYTAPLQPVADMKGLDHSMNQEQYINWCAACEALRAG